MAARSVCSREQEELAPENLAEVFRARLISRRRALKVTAPRPPLVRPLHCFVSSIYRPAADVSAAPIFLSFALNASSRRPADYLFAAFASATAGFLHLTTIMRLLVDETNPPLLPAWP